MSDFDWVGSQWVELGLVVFIVAIIAAVAALVLWTIRRRHLATKFVSDATRA